MTRAHARRLLVLGLVGAGWLSVLGNSAGPEYHRKVIRQTGDITIVPVEDRYADGCRVTASVSTPVRRFASFSGTDLILEFTCLDGSNCLTRLPDHSRPCDAVVVRSIDAGAGGRPPPPSDGSTDAAAPADGGGSSDASAPGIETPEIHSCPVSTESTVMIRMTGRRRYGRVAFCESESATYRLEVETAAGSTSTLEYKIDVDEPGGYFGCS